MNQGVARSGPERPSRRGAPPGRVRGVRSLRPVRRGVGVVAHGPRRAAPGGPVPCWSSGRGVRPGRALGPHPWNLIQLVLAKARTGERMSDEFTRPPSVRPARRPAARRTCRAARRRGRQPDRQRPRLPAAHRARAGVRPARRSRRRDRHGGCHRHRHAAGPPGGRPRPRAGLRPARPYPHHQAAHRRHRELRAAHRVHADPPGARGRRHRARPGSALSRRRLRGRGVLGGDPAAHGVVGPGSPRSHAV